MINENCGTADQYKMRCISWSAIVIGAFVAIGLSFLLHLFGVSIGLSLVTVNQSGMTVLAVGGFIGLLISVFVSMFVSGVTAGYLGRSHCLKRNLGVVYGFASWCLALILAALLASHIMHYVVNYSDFVMHKNVMMSMTQNPDMNTAMMANPQRAVNNLGYASFLVFILFLVGALASCFGGHFGMTCVCCKSCCGKCGCSGSDCKCDSSCKRSCCGKCGCTATVCNCGASCKKE